jgi:osmotically-inducible protein OsmY
MSTASAPATSSGTRSDQDIQRDVLAELKWDARVQPNEVGVAVKDGVVTLTGWVDSYTKKWAAEEAALRVRGVRAVANDIEVRLPTSAERTDADIAAAVVRALEWDAFVPVDKIQVTVSKGWVTLRGEVEWQYQKLDAERVARRITGVRGVTNLITVKPRVTPSELLGGEGGGRAGGLDGTRGHRRREPHRGVVLARVVGAARRHPDRRGRRGNMLTREIPPDQWVRVLDDFSKKHDGWIVEVELLGSTLGDQQESNRLPLVGISADVKGREKRIEVIVGGRPDAHLTRIINRPKRVWLKQPEEPAHEAIEVESEDGIITLVHFRHIAPEVGELQLPGKVEAR